MAKVYAIDPNMDMEIPRDSIFVVPLTFEYEDGTAFDLTGCTIYFVATSDPEGAIASAIINHFWTTHTDATAGETTMTLTADTTASGTDKTLGTYYYNMKVVKSGVNLATKLGRVTIAPNPSKDA